MLSQPSKRIILKSNLFKIIATVLIIVCQLKQQSLVEANSASKQQRQQTKQISIRIPDVRPDHAEQYLCMAHRVAPSLDGEFIVGFNPRGDASRVHHMLMYGCQMPGIYQRDSPNFVWDCSSMHSQNDDPDHTKSFEEGPICQGKQQILYGWALDAPALKLPKGVGFKIGGTDSDINFLVLQVHYGHYHAFARTPELTDNSGLVLDVKPNIEESGISKRAGVLLLMSLGRVDTGKTRHEIWCEIKDDIDIHPFRFRVHTHKLGTRVMGAKIGREQQNSFGFKVENGQIIGVGDPQQPQMFYPVREKNITLARGDTVYGSCEFNNTKGRAVNIGQTGDDEMCNFYLMYWTKSPKLLSDGNCYSQNPSSLSSLLNYALSGLTN